MDSVSSRSSSNAFGQTTEVYIKKLMAGSVADVRLRLIGAVESVGYDVIEEEPQIVARRGASGWGAWYASADIFEYGATLIIRFKSVSESSTQVTFDYVINNPMLDSGDKQMLAQEAKTIAALSKKQLIEKSCAVCATESTDDSRFCRKCGAPLTSEQTELEVLRLMTESRAAKTSVMSATFAMIVAAILVAVALILGGFGLVDRGTFALLASLGGIGILIAVMSSLFGWNRLKRALKTPEPQSAHTPRHFPESLDTGEFPELPPRSSSEARASITEGTTNLLDQEWNTPREKEKVPANQKRETNNFNN